jgi:hypothetical protein
LENGDDVARGDERSGWGHDLYQPCGAGAAAAAYGGIRSILLDSAIANETQHFDVLDG